MDTITLDYSFVEDGKTFTGSHRIRKDQVPKVDNIISIEHGELPRYLCVTHVWPAALVQGKMHVCVEGHLVDSMV